MQLSIIIVNWNSKEFVRQSLGSIYQHTHEPEYEVIVIDSASFDGCREMVESQFPMVRYLQLTENVGFAKANNAAALSAKGDFILFINPDTQVVGGAIDQLWQAAHYLPRAGAVGARLLNPDGTLQTSCVQSFPTLLNQFLDSDCLRRWFPNSTLWGNQVLLGSESQPRVVEAISGACMMIARPAFEAVNGFSTDYFLYAEDLDLCLKLNKARYRNYFIPAATVIHHGGQSTRANPTLTPNVQMRISVYLLLKKFHGRYYAFAYRTLQGLSAIGRLTLLLPSRLGRHTRQPSHRPDLIDKWFSILKWTISRA